MEKSKKLEFNKEQIVNLNDQELQQINGGVAPASTAACVISFIDVTVAITIAILDDDEPASDWDHVSEEFIHVGDEGHEEAVCLLPDVPVRGLRP